MTLIKASSVRAQRALALVESLQVSLAARMEKTGRLLGASRDFKPVHWLRDRGRHGGGTRLQCADTAVFDRASVNMSCVHYDDQPTKRLASANALSAIVHPAHPVGPSMHTHISFTELRDGAGYWRMMADLNPSHPDPTATGRFRAALEDAAPELFAQAAAQGDRYFFIPALDRHRGVAHFYLEQFDSGDFEADLRLAQTLGNAIVRTYGRILDAALLGRAHATEAERATQLEYHTLYLFQVLTLDRGTTSGLLVHSQNDVGVLGSLPSHVSPPLLASWRTAVPEVQAPLVDALVRALPTGDRVRVDVQAKKRLAAVVRAHYAEHPEALALQARGDVVPPTVANHGGAPDR
jgi:coproporphyrinogen III oxidase